ncbi:MAG: hypothetical protein QOF41_2021 [Methylobacteriaceae bacterium]|nr:hypothetical protein [Methylobacteriaceae bacterium]
MIRFFRNGMTNLEAKFIAFEASARFQDKAALAKAIAVFAATERNFTVKKGDRLITEVLREDDERLFAKFVDKLTSSFDSVNYVRNSYLKRERAGFPALSAPLDAPVQRMTTTRVPTRTRL